MDDFPANSHKSREDLTDSPRRSGKKDEIRKVAKSGVTRQKRSLSKRFTEVFVGGDARSAGSYILLDVLLPAAKDMVSDAGSQWIERMLFGESRRPGSRGGSSGYTAYNRYSSAGSPTPSGGRREEPRQQISRRARGNHDFSEIVLAARGEAEEVIDQLFELLNKYNIATVGDLYDMVDIESNFQDEKWGWTDLRGAGVTRVRNGYLLDLPRPEHLD